MHKIDFFEKRKPSILFKDGSPLYRLGTSCPTCFYSSVSVAVRDEEGSYNHKPADKSYIVTG